MEVRNPTEVKAYHEVTELDYEKEEDEFARRYIAANGKEFTIVATDPYGLWKIKNTSGKVPAELDQQFTSVEDAKKEIAKYISKYGKTASNSNREPVRKGTDNREHSVKLPD